MARAVADTNLLVAVMVENDRNHIQAIRIWESFDKFLVPAIALFELSLFLVKNKLNLDLLDQVVTDPKIEFVENNLDDFSYLARHSNKVRHYDDVGDLIIVSVARQPGVELKTSDEDLMKLTKSWQPRGEELSQPTIDNPDPQFSFMEVHDRIDSALWSSSY